MSNSIPNGWGVKNLIDCSVNGISNGVFRDPKTVGEGYKLINVFEMYQGFGVDVNLTERLPLSDKEFQKNKVNFGDVFFTRSSLKLEGIAYCNINLSHDDDITYEGHLMRVVPDRNFVEPEYLARFCLSDEARIFFMSSAKHSSMTTISQSDIAPLKVLLPPLPEQQKIAAILTSVDDVIESTQKQINKLKDLKTGMMQELLTKGIGHSEFKDSPVGRIPKAWEVLNLGQVTIAKGMQTGPFGSQLHSHEYVENGIPVVMPKDMKDQKIVSKTIAKITQEKADELGRHKLIKGDILFSRRGDVGRCVLVKPENEGWVCGTGCLKARLGDRIIPEYFICYLTLTNVVEWLINNSVGQTMLNLNTSILSELPVPVPTLEEQRLIANSMDALINSIDNKERKLEQLNSTKKALMQDLLTGKVRVKVN